VLDGSIIAFEEGDEGVHGVRANDGAEEDKSIDVPQSVNQLEQPRIVGDMVVVAVMNKKRVTAMRGPTSRGDNRKRK